MKLLLAEDDVKLRDTLAEGLRGQGYEVTAVGSGQEAVQAFQEGFHQAVILDVLLPKMTGFEAAKAMRGFKPDLAIVMMSGVYKSQQQQQDNLNAVRAKDYLVKPFELKRLLEVLRPFAPAPHTSSQPPAAAAAPSTPLPPEGNLLESPVLYLGWRIHREQHSGILELFGPDDKARIFVYRGRAIFAQHSDPALNVGIELLRGSELTSDDYKRVAALAFERGLGLGEVLKADGIANDVQLKAAYKKLVPKIVQRSVAMTGRFRFTPTDTFTAIVPTATTGLLESLLSGLRTASPAELEPHVGPRRALRLAPGDNWAEVGALLLPACGSDSLLRAINGRATIAQIIEASPQPAERESRFRQVFLLMSTMAVRASMEPILVPTTPPAFEVADARLRPAAVRAATSGPTPAPPVTPQSAANEPALRPEDEEARQRVEAKHEALKDKDLWAVLGVEKGTDVAGLKRAYFDLAREFHTDAFAGLNLGPAQKRLDRVFATIQDAYATLSDDHKRGEYEAKLQLEQAGGSSDIAAIFQAEADFNKVKLLVDRGDLAGAGRVLEKVLPVMPQNPEVQGYKAFLEWWQTKKPATADAAIKTLQASAKAAPASAAMVEFVGWIFLESGNAKNARAVFKRVLDIDPKNGGASRGMRQALKKLEDEEKAQGGLGKLFKR